MRCFEQRRPERVAVLACDQVGGHQTARPGSDDCDPRHATSVDSMRLALYPRRQRRVKLDIGPVRRPFSRIGRRFALRDVASCSTRHPARVGFVVPAERLEHDGPERTVGGAEGALLGASSWRLADVASDVHSVPASLTVAPAVRPAADTVWRRRWPSTRPTRTAAGTARALPVRRAVRPDRVHRVWRAARRRRVRSRR